MVTVFIENIVLKHKHVDICSRLFHTTFFNYLVKKVQPPLTYNPCIVIIICTIKRSFWISFLFFIQEMPSQQSKNPKKSPKLLNKCIKSHFINVEDGRFPERKTSVSAFMGKRKLAASRRNMNSYWVCKKRNCVVVGKCSTWNLNFQELHQWDQIHYVYVSPNQQHLSKEMKKHLMTTIWKLPAIYNCMVYSQQL